MLFSINWGFVFTIVNLLVLYLLLKRFLFGPVTAIMEQRKQLIEGQLSSAKDTEAKAMMLKARYEDTLSGADAEAEEILEKARRRGQEEYDTILSTADADAKRLTIQAKKEIEAERKKTMRQLSAEIAGLAVSAAEKAVAGKPGVFDEEMMNSFLREEGEPDGKNS